MYLLDTHVLIWWLDTPERLDKKPYEIIAMQSVYISAVSVWEMAIKAKLGKLDFSRESYQALFKASFHFLPITPEDGYVAGNLPMHHQDPFDRMLIAQALTQRLTLITHDQKMRLYDIPLLMA